MNTFDLLVIGSAYFSGFSMYVVEAKYGRLRTNPRNDVLLAVGIVFWPVLTLGFVWSGLMQGARK